ETETGTGHRVVEAPCRVSRGGALLRSSLGIRLRSTPAQCPRTASPRRLGDLPRGTGRHHRLGRDVRRAFVSAATVTVDYEQGGKKGSRPSLTTPAVSRVFLSFLFCLSLNSRTLLRSRTKRVLSGLLSSPVAPLPSQPVSVHQFSVAHQTSLR